MSTEMSERAFILPVVNGRSNCAGFLFFIHYLDPAFPRAEQQILNRSHDNARVEGLVQGSGEHRACRINWPSPSPSSHARPSNSGIICVQPHAPPAGHPPVYSLAVPRCRGKPNQNGRSPHSSRLSGRQQSIVRLGFRGACGFFFGGYKL
jgi:hypothetical protein